MPKNKMPRFVQVNSSDDTDDEVIFVPYVKPPPPVVDLLESSSGDETTAVSTTINDDDQVSKKKKKKKRKKTQNISNNEQEEVNGLTTDNGCENDNSHNNIASSGSDVASQRSATNVEEIIESVAVGHPNGEVINGIDRCEQDGNNVELSEEITPGSSTNAAVPSALSIIPDDNIISSEEPIPSIRIASSIFESNSCAPIPDQLSHDQFIAGVGVTSTPTSKGIQNGPKSRKNAGREKSAIAAGFANIKPTQSKSKATPSPRVRQKRQTPSQRTNIEIANFLNTLGFELEPQDIPGPTRVRKPRRKTDNPNDIAQGVPPVPNGVLPEFSSLLPIVATSTSLPLESYAGQSSANASFASPIANLLGSADFGYAGTGTLSKPAQPFPPSLSSSFVSVTEILETPRSSKKSLKKRPSNKSDEMKKTLTMEDVENATFTGKELQEVELNLKTNLFLDSGNKKKRIELNEKGDPISIAESMEQDDTSVQKAAKECGQDVETSNNFEENQQKDNQSVRNVVEINTNEDESQKLREGKDKESSILNTSETTRKNDNPICNPNNLFFSFGESMEIVQNDPSLNNSTNSNNMIVPSYLPITWSKEMQEFYDTIRGDSIRVSDILSTIPDDRRFWTVPFIPPKPKVKKIRCDNCKQWGHFSRQCTEKRKLPVCKYCGQTGHNGDGSGRGRMCPRPICLNCGKRSRSYSSGCGSCMFGRKPPRCKVCLIEGHEESACPDNWRRFHSVTSTDQFISENNEEPHFVSESAKYRPNRDLYCANCGDKGHGVYDCRVSHRMSQYPRHKQRILKEFATPPKKKNSSTGTQYKDNNTATQPTDKCTVTHSKDEEGTQTAVVTQTNEPSDQGTSERTVISTVVDVKDDNGKGMSVESFQVNLKNDSPLKDSGGDGLNSNCVDYPDCKNRPSTGNSCHIMYNLTPFDHKLLYEAQENNKIENIKAIRDVQITVLNDKIKVHIWGEMHEGAQEDILKLLSELKQTPLRQDQEDASKLSKLERTVPTAKKGKDKPSVSKTASSETETRSGDVSGDKKVVESRKSGSLKDKDEQTVRMELSSLLDEKFESDSAPAASTSTLPPPASPEIITIDDDDDDDIPAQVSQDPNSVQEEEILKVGLLPSEWDLLFPESVKQQGIISQLSRQFQVNIFVSKEDLAAYIQDGTLMNRTLAQKNIVYWLESQAGNMPFQITLTLERNDDEESQDVIISKKRPRSEPKPNFKSPKRPRVDDRSQASGGDRRNDNGEVSRSRSPSRDHNRQRSGSNDDNRDGNKKSRGRGGRNKRRSGSGSYERGRGFIHQNQMRNQFNNMSNMGYFNNNEGPNFNNNYMQNYQIPPPPPDWFSWGDNYGGGGGYNRGNGEEFRNNNNNQQQHHQQGGQGQHRGRLRYYNMSI